MADQTMDQRIKQATEKAREAFWAVIAAEFPEAKTGDVGPDGVLRFHAATEMAVEGWVEGNVPGFCLNCRNFIPGATGPVICEACEEEVDRA